MGSNFRIIEESPLLTFRANGSRIIGAQSSAVVESYWHMPLVLLLAFDMFRGRQVDGCRQNGVIQRVNLAQIIH